MSLSERALAQTPQQRVAPLRVLDGDARRLLVHEVYRSLQGEGTRAGVPCTFVRLTGCHLRCQYCDTEHAFEAGTARRIDEVAAEVHGLGAHMVQLTGGEPLLQKGAARLIEALSDLGHQVVIETSGATTIAGLDRRRVVILDVKTPGSGEAERNRWANLRELQPGDEIKFVLTSRDDYEWAKDVYKRKGLGASLATVLFSPAAPDLTPTTLADWMIADKLDVRFQLQMHKVLWGERQGV